MFERAIEADPNFAQAYAFLAETLIEVAIEFWTPNPEEHMTTMDQALTTRKRPWSLMPMMPAVTALLLRTSPEKSFERAAHHLGVARRLNRNDADVFGIKVGLPFGPAGRSKRCNRLNRKN